MRNGGFVLLWAYRRTAPSAYHRAEEFPLSMATKIGFIQCLAMIPGVSRSGATIVGALLLGADKRSAAEFSFFLAMPTMMGAFAYDLYKNQGMLDGGAWGNIVIGFIFALITAVIVVLTEGYGRLRTARRRRTAPRSPSLARTERVA